MDMKKDFFSFSRKFAWILEGWLGFILVVVVGFFTFFENSFEAVFL